MSKIDLEKEFIAWAEARDDDWWENGTRISIWDFRVMLDFFLPKLAQAEQEGQIKMFNRLYSVVPPEKEDIFNDMASVARALVTELNKIRDELKSNLKEEGGNTK